MRFSAIFFLIILLTSLSPFSKHRLIVSSPAFAHNQMIPAEYSCEGVDMNPPLHIDNIPSNTVSLAIIIHDPDASARRGFTHWVVWNIEVSQEIPRNFNSGDIGLNSDLKNRYKGMCPTSGTHYYHFIVYALNTKLGTNINVDKRKLEEMMRGHILAKGELVGLYRKPSDNYSEK